MEQAAQKIETELQTQIEYYFSSVNLLTDELLRAQIKRGKNHWVSFNFLLKCNRVVELLKKLEIDGKSRKKELYRVLQQSHVLKVRRYRVKSTSKSSQKREMRKMIYLQFQTEEAANKMEQELQTSQRNEKSMKISRKCGQRWILMVFDNEAEKAQLEKQLRDTTSTSALQITRILSGPEWEEQQRYYQTILAALKKSRNGWKGPSGQSTQQEGAHEQVVQQCQERSG